MWLVLATFGLISTFLPDIITFAFCPILSECCHRVILGKKVPQFRWNTNPKREGREGAQLTRDVHPERGGDGEAHVVVDGLADEDGVEVGVADGRDAQRVDRGAVHHLVGVVDQGVLAPPRQARRRVACVVWI